MKKEDALAKLQKEEAAKKEQRLKEIEKERAKLFNYIDGMISRGNLLKHFGYISTSYAVPNDVIEYYFDEVKAHYEAQGWTVELIKETSLGVKRLRYKIS